ncbi:MAG: hypothetical protein L3J80_04185 [Thermoplasmata archaeon]|nr:hypothetical protein [Thermoplasmata archaeon]
MRRRSPTPRAGSSPSDLPELTGFLEGVRHRLLERRRKGTPLPDLEQRLASAQAAIVARRFGDAERILLEVSEHLDRDETEPELNEFPRGLIRYDAGTDRGVPTPEDEEPVANRLTLMERLLTVSASEGVNIVDLRATLVLARAEYAVGDRRRAKELGEKVLTELELRRADRSRTQP